MNIDEGRKKMTLEDLLELIISRAKQVRRATGGTTTESQP